jgi:hypothetical protein
MCGLIAHTGCKIKHEIPALGARPNQEPEVMGNRGTRGSLDADEVTDGDVAKRLSLVVGVSSASRVRSRAGSLPLRLSSALL